MKQLIGIKKEMTQIFAEDGRVIPVTLIDVSDVVVTGSKTMDKDGYVATVMAKGTSKSTSKAELGQYKELGYIPRFVVEARDIELAHDAKLSPEMFEINEKVNVVGVTKGKGFQGVVKRWGFHGGPKTHGQSDRHRAPGSIGAGTTPGRVTKGRKMGGHMGDATKTVKNLKVVFIDANNGLIGLKGAVPGNKGSLVIIKSNK